MSVLDTWKFNETQFNSKVMDYYEKCLYKMDLSTNRTYALQVWFHDGEEQTYVCQTISWK